MAISYHIERRELEHLALKLKYNSLMIFTYKAHSSSSVSKLKCATQQASLNSASSHPSACYYPIIDAGIISIHEVSLHTYTAAVKLTDCSFISQLIAAKTEIVSNTQAVRSRTSSMSRFNACSAVLTKHFFMW
jgi:hypothetical protein